MVAHIGTCGAHVNPTTAQATWRRRTVLSARKPMPTGAAGKHLGQYSSGIRTAMFLECLWSLDPHFQVTLLSTPLDLHGGKSQFICMLYHSFWRGFNCVLHNESFHNP